jgi:hypothetical protein
VAIRNEVYIEPELTAERTQIQRILQSRAFRTSELQRNLLAYLADKSIAGTADQLKEYTIGLDVFAKPESYDPRHESVVRMHAARLRQKLADYYHNEGTDDGIFVDLPKGAFKLTFENRAVKPESEAAPAAAVSVPAPARRSLPWKPVLAGLFVLALALSVWRMRPAPVSVPELPPDLSQLWAPLVASSRPLMVCLSTSQEGITGAGTATGAFLLGQFLAQQKKNAMITRSDLLSVPELMVNNMIFVGSTVGVHQTEPVFSGLELRLAKDGIHNLRPRAGEPALIADKADENGDTEETYALITHAPGLHGNGENLYLSGNQISSVMAGVQAFTDPAIAHAVFSKMKHDGSIPRFYQLVLRIRTMDSMPVDISYVLHRSLGSQ